MLDVILSEFNKLGYKTVYGILDAVNYGVPQFRERFVLIGSRDHEDIFLPVPTHFQMHQNPGYRWKTVGEAIRDLEDDEGECGKLPPERKKYLQMVPEGGNWRDLPEEIIPAAMGGAYESGGGKVGFCRRLTYSQPAPTITTSPAQKATMLCHPKKDSVAAYKESHNKAANRLVREFSTQFCKRRWKHRLGEACGIQFGRLNGCSRQNNVIRTCRQSALRTPP